MDVRLVSIGIVAFFASVIAGYAQQPQQHQHPPDHKVSAPSQPTDDRQMDTHMVGPLGITLTREGSGTSWLPDATPMYALHAEAGPWSLMLHESLFVHYIHEGGARGDKQFGSTNWVMGMAHRNVADGMLMLRGMLSIEPLTVGACGYPTLLATGETCKGEPLHDRQHPHDVFMEIAAQYQRAINPQLAFQAYAALAGEPALGPVAFPHRVSALPNPLAPITHHWLDSTHISFGVVSAGLYQQRWKAEGSIFNGREPDETRHDLDFAPLDSYSGRLWLLPTERWALQVSAGHLNEAEQEHIGGPRRDVDRVTASVTYHRPRSGQQFWASTIAWGHNREEGAGTNAWLAESSFAVDDRNIVFGRGELNEKTAHDLVLPDHHEEGTYTVGKLQAGYTRQLRAFSSFAPAVGASVSFGFVPAPLASLYGGRASAGFAVFLSVRPSQTNVGPGHQHP